jgi:predicted nucleic acid-binding protein
VIVADTNLIVHLLLTGERTHWAQMILMKDSDWAAPLLWRSEFCNVLTNYLKKNLLDLLQVKGRMHEAINFMVDREYESNYSRVLELANKSNCTAYDCEFVALAYELGCPLITVDRQIREQFPEIALSPERYLET